MHYSRHSPYSSVIITAKYHGRPEIARIVGRRYAAEMAPCGFFSGVDALVPVPMHWWKKARRGYNQAEVVAEGVSEATGIPVIHDAMRAARHATQTRKTLPDAWPTPAGFTLCAIRHCWRGNISCSLTM